MNGEKKNYCYKDGNCTADKESDDKYFSREFFNLYGKTPVCRRMR